jgi:hypothetical protein
MNETDRYVKTRLNNAARMNAPVFFNNAVYGVNYDVRGTLAVNKFNLRIDGTPQPVLGSPSSIRATVFNDKIYLFYWRREHFYYATYDGKDWKEIGVIKPPSGDPHKYHPFVSVKPVIRFTLFSQVRRGHA